jgi:hypothetical protein
MSKYGVDVEKWQQLTLFEQMGNIGSEVGRALAAKRHDDQERKCGALYRGLDLIDLTAQLWARKYPYRTRELLRAREQFVEAIITDKQDDKLEDYFMWFAALARADR